MHDVFISYSTRDMTQAEMVRDVLEKNGIPCWMAPRDIPGGSNYAREIPVAIRSCQVFVLILSENAQASNWVIKELDSAVNCGKVILPFMLEDCPLSDEFNFLLTGAQRYAAYQKKAEVLNTLVSRIKAITGPAPEAPKAEVIPQAPVQTAPAPKRPEPKTEPAPVAKPAPAAKPVPAAKPAPKAAVPVVQQAKPRKPAKAKPDRPKVKFTFGKVEGMAALAVPAMMLLPGLAYLLGNLIYWWDSWRSVRIDALELDMILMHGLLGLLLGAGMCAEWIYFRLRERTVVRSTPVCPNCGDNEIQVKTFRTGRVTRKEKLLALLIPAGGIVAVPLCFIGMAFLLQLKQYYYFHTATQQGCLFAAVTLGLGVGAWLSNRIVRNRRRKAGLRAGTCVCRDCRATFVPVLSEENIED